MAKNNSKEPLGIRVFRGVELHLLGQAAVFVSALAITPILVRGLGTDGYALYTLIWTLLNYLALFGLGTSTATQRYTALFTAQNDTARLAGLLRSSLLFQIGTSLLGGALNFALHSWMAAHILNMDAGLVSTAKTVFASVSFAVPFFFILRFAMDILYGCQRFGAYNFFYALQMLSLAVMAAVLVKTGRGLEEIALSFICILAVLSAAALWTVRAVLWPGAAALRAGDTKDYAVFSIKGFLSQALWILTFQGDRVFIGALLPLEQMGFYAIASGIAQKLNTLCAAVSATMFPIFAELQGKQETARLRRVYLKATQLTMFLIIPIAMITFILAPQFLTLWLGESFSQMGTWPMRILVISNLAYVGTYLPNNIATGKGHPHWQGVMQAGKAVLLVACWAILIPSSGILGASAGLALAEWVGTPIFLWVVHKQILNIGWWEFFKEGCWRPVCAGAAVAVMGLATHGFVGSWSTLFLFGLAAVGIYLVAGYAILEEDAKKLLREWVSRHIPSRTR
jgi:O-antigen/teichoic acid export membrane protein